MKLFSKLPAFPRFKRSRRKTMRATVARRPLRAATADYEDMAEPNMKLSRALLIVLLLHVVAVSGIIAFNAIKTRQGPSMPRLKTTTATTAPKQDGINVSPGTETEKSNGIEIRPAKAVGKPNTKDHGKTADAAHRDDSHRTYTVAKGDNPAAIAKKFKVPYDELLALNHIDDPKKLKIGQKLLIPNKNPKSKKSDE